MWLRKEEACELGDCTAVAFQCDWTSFRSFESQQLDGSPREAPVLAVSLT